MRQDPAWYAPSWAYAVSSRVAAPRGQDVLTDRTRKYLRRLIATVQLYGAVGFAYLVAEDLWPRPVFLWMDAVCEVCLVFAAIATLGGIGLWRNKNRGVRLSLITQFAQLFTVKSSVIGYSAVLGAAAWLGFSVTDRGAHGLFDFAFGYSQFRYSINVPPAVPSAEFSIEVNLLAVLFSMFLLEEYRNRSRPVVAKGASDPLGPPANSP